MEEVTVKMPEGYHIFEDRYEWESRAHWSRMYDGENMEGSPESYPAIGWKVFTVRELDTRDTQVWAFIYPCK